MTMEIRNTCVALAVVLGLGVVSTTDWCQTLPPVSAQAWYWPGGVCDGCRKLGLEVLLNGSSLYRGSFSLRCMERAKASPKDVAGRLAFSFKGGHNFQHKYRTAPKETIEVTIWQAGAEPDGLVLGLTFATKDQIVLNTLHFAAADRNSEMLLDRGLLVRTCPLPRSRPRSRTPHSERRGGRILPSSAALLWESTSAHDLGGHRGREFSCSPMNTDRFEEIPMTLHP
jgi:hypothetical protein